MLLLPLLAFSAAHKFYLSVTNIEYSEKSKALQITSRVFIDDLEALLLERYDFKGNYDFIGKKYEDDLIICYIEVPELELSEHSSLTIQNDVLTDMFKEQQNIVHLKINNQKKSFVLVKENSTGVLKL